MNIEPRALPLAEQIINATGLQLTYPFDDLVFVENNPFLLRFNDKVPSEMYLHFNIDCIKEDALRLEQEMEMKAYKLGISLVKGLTYTMQQKENTEEIELKFG